MRALQRCDFCGGDAVGTFEIVPPELDPTEAEQRRVILCADCSTRLETLLEPLLDRLAAGETTRTRVSKGPNSDLATQDTDSSAETTQHADSNPEIAIETEPIAIESSNDATTGESTDSPVTSESTADPDDDEPTATAEPDESQATAGPNAEESTATTGSDTDESTTTPVTDEQDDTVAASDAGTGPDAQPSSDAGSASDQQQAVGAAAGRPRVPPAYNKVLRLLRNRTEPMDRSALETLATSAYDLEHHEVTAIVDHAIDNGDLREDGGQLRPA